LGTQMEAIIPTSAPDPISEPKGDWNVAAAIVFALVLDWAARGMGRGRRLLGFWYW
jgi:hypothetical protein